MSRTKIIETKEWDIIASDFTNMQNQQEILDALDALTIIIAQRDRPCCILYDATGTHPSYVSVNRATEF
jgi:hypothetical protein